MAYWRNGKIRAVIHGFVIGTCNVIPGVSGGTAALILGVYQRILSSVSSISWATVKTFFFLFTCRKKDRAAFIEEMQRIDMPFLSMLAAGALAAIYSLAFLLTYLLQKHEAPTNAFFFGLIFVSILFPYELIGKKSWREAMAGAIGIAFMVAFTYFSVTYKNPLVFSIPQDLSSSLDAQRVDSAIIQSFQKNKKIVEADSKVTLLKAKKEWLLESQGVSYFIMQADGKLDVYAKASKHGKSSATPSPRAKNHSWFRLAFYFLAGIVGICAMILPGISGSLMLLLMGAYFDILEAVKGLDLVVIACFGAGCAVGMLGFTRLMNYLIARFHDLTMAFLTGLVIGSLYGIWPFRRPNGQNVIPDLEWQTWVSLGTFIAGCLLVAAFYIYESKNPADSSK